MHNLPTDNTNYNDEPVFYCRNCLSLRIRAVPGLDNAEFCDECNSTDIAQCSIEEWKTMYKDKYGFDYLEKDY